MDATEQFDAGDGDRGRLEPFETEHRTDAKFHAAVVLFDQVVQIFGSPAKTVGGPGLLAALRIASKPPVNYR